MQHRPRFLIATSLLLGCVLQVSSCMETSVTAVDVNIIRIEPDSLAVSVGSTARLAASLLDASGNVLGGRTITWSSADPAIATVDGSGTVSSLLPGRTTITATSEGVSGNAVFVATAAPAIGVQPSAVAFSAITGGPVPPARTIAVSNAGTGTLTGLGTAILYGDGASVGWLTASLDRTTAPATLTTAIARTTLPEGRYEATITVSMISGNSVDVPVAFTVEAPAPAIALGRTSVAFALVSGGTLPPGQTIAITNGGGGTLAGLGASVTYDGSQPAGWLNATVSPSTAPAALSVSVNTAALEPGTYDATVQVVSPGADNSPRAVDVTLSVSPAPVPTSIELSATAVSFSATEGGADPAQQFVLVNNGGDGILSGLRTTVRYGTGQPDGWLVAAPGRTTAPTSITLSATVGSLAAGTYDATVEVASAAAVNSPQSIAVTLVVAGAPVPPAIALSATSVSFNAPVGGSDPAAGSISVTNGGGGSLTGLATSISYESGQPTGWLSAVLASPNAPTSIALNAATGSLEDGTYDASVDVSSPVAGNSPQTIAVTFVVGPAPEPPAIVLSAANASFSATAGAGNPAAQNISVSNGGEASLTGLATSISYQSGQPGGWLSAILAGTSAPTSLALNATTGSLVPGAYAATVAVASPVADNSPQAITVTFTVLPATPTPPSDLKADGKKGGKIQVEWSDNSDDETSFRLQMSESGSGPWTNIDLPANTTKHTVEGLKKGDTRYFRVRACNLEGCSAPSNVDSDRAG